MGKKHKLPLLEGVDILDVGAEGRAVCRHNDMVVFVSNAIPGDVVDIQIYKKRRRFLEGKAIKFHSLSQKRVEPFCTHFGICGGCKWQHLNYKDQLFYKQKQVDDQLKRISGLDLPKSFPIVASKQTEFYRNKLEFTFSDKRWFTQEEIDSKTAFDEMNPVGLGFHIPGMFDKVVDIEKCYLQAEPSNQIRNFIRSYAIENGLSFFNLRDQHGFLRNLIIRTTSTRELMIIVCFFYEDVNEREALLNELKNQFPEISSLMYVINEKKNDSISDQEVICYSGKDFIEEEMEGLKFKIGPKSFYQTNSVQAYELYKVTRDFAGLSGNELVYDLYTGTGTIANFIARKTRKVIGIEYVEDAIEDAKFNSKRNGIDNTLFYADDMKDILTTEFIETHGKADVVITDPPRAGMHPDVVTKLLEIGASKIVYVSCNPATQARDLALLANAYSVTKVQAVDMFPHTYHVENVVLLEKR